MESFLRKNNAKSLTSLKKRSSMSRPPSNSLSSKSSYTSTSFSMSPSTSTSRTTASSGRGSTSNMEKIMQQLDMEALKLQMELEELEQENDKEPRVQKEYKILQCVKCRAKQFKPVEVTEVPLAEKYHTKGWSVRGKNEAAKKSYKAEGYLCISCSISLRVKQEKYESITDTPLYTQ